MSEYTPNLNLFKYNTSTDGKEVFSIAQALNRNWDILDNLGSGRNIGEIVASTLPLEDAGLHLLDGALINGSGIYSEFVQYIANLYTNNPTATYFTNETTWQDTVTNYGVCGKFVYDSGNNTVRLPKYSDKIYTTSIEQNKGLVKGTGIALGFTDGSGNYGLAPSGNTENNWQYRSGNYGLSIGTNIGRNQGGCPGDANTLGITLDASKSGMEVELTDITSPLEGYYYIVVANSTKTDIQVDIDEIVTDLNSKADVDLNNTSPSAMFKSNSVSWCMPDYENQITGSGKNWVQCSKDSFICIWGSDPYTEDFRAQVSPNNGTDIFTVGVRSDDLNSNTQTTSFTFLCPKNWYFRCTSENTPTYVIYPLKGAN